MAILTVSQNNDILTHLMQSL